MAKKKQTIVGSALTPDSLLEFGAVKRFPPPATDFRPDGSWQQSYRIWTCHGYKESGNDNVGAMRLARAAKSDGTFLLEVHQTVVQVDGLTCNIKANIECRRNVLGSPAQWDIHTTFVGEDGAQMPELESRKRGQATSDVDRTTGDWCLFEVAQRLDYDKDTSLDFDLLEGLELSKLSQRLTYRGVSPTKIEGAGRMHCFAQVGAGILPTEYWLDDKHRLLCVISMNKAYILDGKAFDVIKAPAW